MSSPQIEGDSCVDISGNQPQFLEETLSHEEPPDVLIASSEGLAKYGTLQLAPPWESAVA